MTEPLVRIRALTVEAATPDGLARILRGIDLDIPRGRILGLVGESGSGKSTLVSCLLRLLPANVARLDGSILFDGADLLAVDDEALRAYRGRRIAMIFQDPMTALNPLFTVGSHLLEALRRRSPTAGRRAGEAEAAAMLARVGLADARARLGAYPHELSGGMRQRVMIAMALLAGPELIVADEPTTALDATIEAQVLTIFEGLRADFAGTMVFISHQLGLVARLCDDVAVMYGGTVVETGTVAEVLARPAHPYTTALLACEVEEGTQSGRLRSIPGEVPSPLSPMTGCIFAPRCALRIAECDAGVPALREVAPGRRAACIRA